MEAGPASAFCPLSVDNETLLFAGKSRTFAPRRNLFPPPGPPFGDFCTNGSVVEQFCNRCAHRFSRSHANATFRARLAVPRKYHFADCLCPKVLKLGVPPPPPPHPLLHTHAHPTHTHGRPRPYTHIRLHTPVVPRPASLSGRRPAAQRLASLSRPAGWPGPCGRLPATKNRARNMKIPTFQMVPKYYYNTPMGSKMPSNHINMHFCAPNSIS